MNQSAPTSTVIPRNGSFLRLSVTNPRISTDTTRSFSYSGPANFLQYSSRLSAQQPWLAIAAGTH